MGSCGGKRQSRSYAASTPPLASTSSQPMLSTHPAEPLVAMLKTSDRAAARARHALPYASLQVGVESATGWCAGAGAEGCPIPAAAVACDCWTGSAVCCTGCTRRCRAAVCASWSSCRAAFCSLVTRSSCTVFFLDFQKDSSCLHVRRLASGSCVLCSLAQPSHFTSYMRAPLATHDLTMRSTVYVTSFATSSSSAEASCTSICPLSFCTSLRSAARLMSHDQKPAAFKAACTAPASSHPALSVCTVRQSMVGFLRQRASNAI
mmetsp:Transcript_18136/g.52913  ORF Transcript_18136/g.52913 Transcript_18136/m.52913 type:complete len:263 (+) Transcript_18136:1408-2196(+)